MIIAKRMILFVFFFSFFIHVHAQPRIGGTLTLDEMAQTTDYEQVISHLYTIHDALYRLNKKIKDGVMPSADQEGTAVTIELLQKVIQQMVEQSHDQTDHKGLQLLGALDDTMLERIASLCQDGNTIEADELMNVLEQLQSVIKNDEQQYQRLADQITALGAQEKIEHVTTRAPVWYTRVIAIIKQSVATVVRYTLGNKIFVGAAGCALGLYVLIRMSQKEKEKPIDVHATKLSLVLHNEVTIEKDTSHEHNDNADLQSFHKELLTVKDLLIKFEENKKSEKVQQVQQEEVATYKKQIRHRGYRLLASILKGIEEGPQSWTFF